MPIRPENRAGFRIGDRVTITGHVPGRGFTGKIIGPGGREDLDWVIELGSGDALANRWTAQPERNLREAHGQEYPPGWDKEAGG